MNDVQKTKNSRALNKGPEKLKLKTKQKKLLAKKLKKKKIDNYSDLFKKLM